MTQEKSSQVESPTKTMENADYSFILKMQSPTEIQKIWGVLFQRLSTRFKIKHARLIYRVGILFELIGIDTNGVIYQRLTDYTFGDFRNDFDYKSEDDRIILFKRSNSDCIQLELESKQPLSEELSALAHIFFNQLFLVMRIKNFEYNSVKDDITKAFNQNYLKAFIQNEIERARRYASVFSIIFFDLDNLKAVNDLHGHLVGTEILKEVADILREQVRKVDVLSRFGGDEFVIVLLHADPSKAHEVSLRIREAVKAHDFLKNQNLNIKITGCFGISSFPENGNTVEDLIRKADLAMYDVKRKGKDGIKIYEGDR